MAEITSEEFERWMSLIRQDIQGVHERLDALNGRTRAAETKIAVLEDRADSNGMKAVGAGLGTVIVAALEAVHLWASSK